MFYNLDKLHEFVDETVDSIYKQFPDAIKCKPGCADCCHAVFDVSFVEAAKIAEFLSNKPELVRQQQTIARDAAVAFEAMVADGADPAKQRIRCPLLSNDNLCLGHSVRPVNCRTYGTPTLINGKTHVCGLSGFMDNESYPTIDLAPLQKSLNDYSVRLVGEEFGNRRYPISWIFLKLNFFLPR